MARNVETKGSEGGEETVRQYFELVSALRKGDKAAVEGLMDFWHPEEFFKFAGASPLSGSFSGAMAIRTLYQNRVNACGMKVSSAGADGREIRLGIVEMKVNKTSSRGVKTLAGWRTVVGTSDNRGFDASGSHEFTSLDGKIKKLRVRVGDKPMASRDKSVSRLELAVSDVGRLSLAAWAVVA